ncbi:hypothetical protein Phou_072760 [Phytohabitans houttuyneae]|uniref:Uncharacterized protein n=1 Tax=Phytohabitans houttuyneae TaxID=1076126 RepID=A0A6V8KMB6_9ACTN|nr:hypothetical protein Phou_072760 [Phytohabitans houttuyneae]
MAAAAAGVLLLFAAPAAAPAHSRGGCTDRFLFCEDFERLPLGGAASLKWA